MRLWQKIFLLTYLFTTLAVNSVAFMLMDRNQNSSLVLAKEKAQAVFDTVISELERCIQNEKARTGSFLLSEQEITSLLAAKIQISAWDCKIEVKPLEMAYFSVSRLPETAKTYQTEFLEEQTGEYLIRVASTVFWEGRFYRISTKNDISRLMAQFYRDRLYSQWLGGGVALITAIALLISSLVLTHPLKYLKTATRQIAYGEYQNRIVMKGHDEIAELAGHMNAMSAKIQASIHRIEKISKNQEIFIANMTHEMKTPLTSILGFADILIIKGDIKEEERREYASIIAAEAKRLRLLSSKLMELISLQETKLFLQPVNMKELLMRSMEAFAPICEEHQCVMRSKLRTVYIDADDALFTSLVLNLLDNALKASGPGQSIDISLMEEKGKALLQMQDHGIGIPQEQVEHVTEAFYMVDKARSRSAGGSGIGLALCKAVVEAHHGSFAIESQENRGTKVSLTFPVSRKDNLYEE